MIDCDRHDSGCSGGNLDNAWEFLVKQGLPHETCYPYRHYPGPPPPAPPPACAFTNDTNYKPISGNISVIGIDSPAQCCERCGETPGCVVGVYQPLGLCHLKAAKDISGGGTPMAGWVASRVAPPSPPKPPSCPTQCHDGTLLVVHKAASAYAVGAPGGVEAMQRELMTHGPFEVGFEVFSDFGSYKNGTYTRTKGALGPGGGHAVKVVGWGTDVFGVPYVNPRP